MVMAAKAIMAKPPEVLEIMEKGTEAKMMLPMEKIMVPKVAKTKVTSAVKIAVRSGLSIHTSVGVNRSDYPSGPVVLTSRHYYPCALNNFKLLPRPGGETKNCSSCIWSEFELEGSWDVNLMLS